MSFEIQCNQCAASLRLDESQAGSITNCPSCGQVIFVKYPPPPAAGSALMAATLTAPSQIPLAPEPAEPYFSPLGDDELRPPTPLPAESEQAAPVYPSEPMPWEEEPGVGQVDLEPPSPESATPTLPSAAAPSTTAAMVELTKDMAADAIHRAAEPSQSSPVKTKPPLPMGLLVGVYVSGVILGLILGRFIFGGQTKSAPADSTGLEVLRDDGVNKDKTKWVNPTEPVPPDQRKRVGETVHLGQLAVSAVSVEQSMVSMVRLDPFSDNMETTTSTVGCLVLRLKLKNTSSDMEFAPLDERFLRPHDPKRRPNYSFIELLDENDQPQISMFELDELSERNIVGQPFDAIRPGEELEAIVAAAEDSAIRAKGRMLWRVQLRAGGVKGQTYSTVVGFEFTPDEIKR